MARGAASVRALVALAAGALATFVTASADAQSSRSLTQVERDRSVETARVERMRAEAAATLHQVAELDARLVESGRRRAEAEAAACAAEERLAALDQQIAADSLRQRRSREAFESALISAALNARRVEPAAVRRTIFARAAAPGLSHHERTSSHALATAQALSGQIAEERAVLAAAEAAIDAERTELAALLARRRSAQVRLTQDAEAAERRIQALSAEARTLRELAQRVQPAAVRRSSGPNSIPAGWLAPAQGRIVRGFGVRDGGGPASQGVAVRTTGGAQVTAPASGRIAYAGPFRSYGQVLILNLDGGYALVLTGLGAISAQVGEPVRAGQPIGEMPLTATPAPELYVEVRRNGQPVDPGRWLGAEGLAAQRGVRAG